MVPTALEWTAKTILNTGIIAPTVAIAGNANNIAVSNVFQGAADLIVNPWLTSATAWYLLDVARPIRPFIFQRRTEPEFTLLNLANDSNVFWQDQYSYGVRLRGNAGYGLWFMACKADV
jgi:phage major head subunit gpT-like protein